MKKYPKSIKIIVSVLLALIMVPAMALEPPSPKLPVEYINSDKNIANCKERGLEHRILLITSRYCSHCKEAIKKLTPLISQCKLTNNLQVLDVINKNDAEALAKLAMVISGVPVLIINCKAYVGTKGTEQYKDLLKEFCRRTET